MSTERTGFDAMAMILDQEEDDDELHAILDRIDLNCGGDDDIEVEDDDSSGDDGEDEVGEVVVRARSSRNSSILFPVQSS
jgi:hypothetical protein